MLRAAIYARKSTDQDGVAEDQKSIPRQIDHARAYAARKGWVVAEDHVYSDEGISGAEFTKRPGFVRLMNALSPRAPFDVLIMAEESRLGREQIQTAYAMQQLIDAGVRLFFYLEDRERTLDSAIEKAMLALQTMADEMEREKARQRTYDAMVRKARAGHVTGGRTFGYDNFCSVCKRAIPPGERRCCQSGRTERRINASEAAAVRTIFERSAEGWGHTRIAKSLNAEGVPAPRSQQGRPKAWCPSTVFEALHREVYRGVITWNKTRKRDKRGRKNRTAKPAAEWMRVEVPELRIVSEELWAAVQARMAAGKAQYLRSTNGRLWGRPHDQESQYLLTGFVRCPTCNASMVVTSRSHGSPGKRGPRKFFYRCLSVHKRGPSVCQNTVLIPMEDADRSVVDTLLADVLTPDVVEDTIRTVLAELAPARRDADAARLRAELTELDKGLARLASAIATTTTAIPALLAEMASHETRRGEVAAQLARVEAAVPEIDLAVVREKVTTRLQDWRDVLAGHAPQARLVLRKLITQPMVAEVEADQVVLTGKASYSKLLHGLAVPNTLMASPTGIGPFSVTGEVVLLRAA